MLRTRILNLNSVIGSMETMVRSLTSDNVELEHDLTENLWSIEADRGQIEQVLMNLVVDTLNTMPKRRQTSNSHSQNVQMDRVVSGVRFAPIQNGPYAMFSVQDTGHGIQPKILRHIFEPFFTTKDKIKGSGLRPSDGVQNR